MRAALGTLADVAPEWLCSFAPDDWYERSCPLLLSLSGGSEMGTEKQRFTSRVLLARSVFSSAQQWVVPTHTRISLVVWLMGAICARSLVGVSTPILLFFLLGGVALHERLVGATAPRKVKQSRANPSSLRTDALCSQHRCSPYMIVSWELLFQYAFARCSRRERNVTCYEVL